MGLGELFLGCPWPPACLCPALVPRKCQLSWQLQLSTRWPLWFCCDWWEAREHHSQDSSVGSSDRPWLFSSDSQRLGHCSHSCPVLGCPEVERMLGIFGDSVGISL